MMVHSCDFSYTMYTVVSDPTDWILEVYIEQDYDVNPNNIYYINRSGIIAELSPVACSRADFDDTRIRDGNSGRIEYRGKNYYGSIKWIDGYFTDLVEGRLFSNLSRDDANKLAEYIRVVVLEVLL